MKKVILSLTILLAGLNSFAGNKSVELISFQTTYSGGNEIYSSTTNAPSYLSDVNLFLPIRLNSSVVLFSGLKYRNLNIVDGGYLIPKTQLSLHSKQITLGAMYKMDKMNFYAFILPTIASDNLNDFAIHDFNYYWAGLAEYFYSENLSFGGGYSYSDRGGDKIYSPLVKFKYTRNNWSIDALLPSKLSVDYHLNKSKIGVHGKLEGQRFEINSKKNLDSSSAFHYRNYFLGAHVDQQVSKNIFLKGEIGYVLGRRMSTESSQNVEVPNNVYLNLGLSFKVFPK